IHRPSGAASSAFGCMSGALNRRSTTAGRVGTAAGLPPASCARAIRDEAIPATNADAVPMNSRRFSCIDHLPMVAETNTVVVWAAHHLPGGFDWMIDDRWRDSVTRREALLTPAGMLAGSLLLRAQLDPRPLDDHRRVPGLAEMMSAFDFEPTCFRQMTLRHYEQMAHGR